MTGRRTNIAIVTLTAIAALVAEFGQVGCHASCFAAAIGKVAQCPLSCCSQKPVSSLNCCSVLDHSAKNRDGNCPQCPVCRAPTRAITSSKATLQMVANTGCIVPVAVIPKVTPCEFARLDLRVFTVIAALHPALQVLNCVWRN